MREKFDSPQYARKNVESSGTRKKSPPPAETFAEIYYYKKQIDARTLLVFVLQDGEQIIGTIEWYDLDALKINRENAPNLLLPKQNIKYIYKAEEPKKS